MPHSGTRWDFPKAASTSPMSAARGAQEGSWLSPGQLFEPRDHFPVDSTSQKTDTAFFQGTGAKADRWEGRSCLGLAAEPDPGGVSRGDTAVSPTRTRLGRTDARCPVMALVGGQEGAAGERGGRGRGRTPRRSDSLAAAGICAQGCPHTCPVVPQPILRLR